MKRTCLMKSLKNLKSWHPWNMPQEWSEFSLDLGLLKTPPEDRPTLATRKRCVRGAKMSLLQRIHLKQRFLFSDDVEISSGNLFTVDEILAFSLLVSWSLALKWAPQWPFYCFCFPYFHWRQTAKISAAPLTKIVRWTKNVMEPKVRRI